MVKKLGFELHSQSYLKEAELPKPYKDEIHSQLAIWDISQQSPFMPKTRHLERKVCKNAHLWMATMD